MPKNYDISFVASLEAEQLTYFNLVEIQFDDEIIRMTTLPYGVDLTFQGQTWYGLSNLLEISEVRETADMSIDTFSITLSGIDTTYVQRAMSDYYQGRTLLLYHGIMNPDGTFLIEPLVINSGVIDNQTISIGETATIQVTVRPHITRVLESIEERYTDEDQKAKFPNDTGLRLVSTLPNKQYSWGTFITQKAYLLNRL